MNENLTALLEQIAAVVLFLATISLSIMFLSSSETIQTAVVERISNKSEVFSAFSANTEERTLTSNEVVTEIISLELDADVYVDGNNITSYIAPSASGNSSAYTQIKSIADNYSTYRIEYVYGDNRTVTEIHYIPVI